MTYVLERQRRTVELYRKHQKRSQLKIHASKSAYVFNLTEPRSIVHSVDHQLGCYFSPTTISIDVSHQPITSVSNNHPFSYVYHASMFLLSGNSQRIQLQRSRSVLTPFQRLGTLEHPPIKLHQAEFGNYHHNYQHFVWRALGL